MAWETPYFDNAQAKAEKCPTNIQAAIRPVLLCFGSMPYLFPFIYSYFFFFFFNRNTLPIYLWCSSHTVSILPCLSSSQLGFFCKVLSCFILGSCVHPICNQLWLLVGFLPCIYSSPYLFGLSPYSLFYICPVIMQFWIPTEKPAVCLSVCQQGC